MLSQADKMLQRAGVFTPAYRDVRQVKGASGAHFSACPAGLFFAAVGCVTKLDNMSDIACVLRRAEQRQKFKRKYNKILSMEAYSFYFVSFR